MERSEPFGDEQVWQTAIRQIKEKINSPISGLLLARRGWGHLWVDMAGDLSQDIAGPLKAMLLIPLAHLTDLELQPNEIMVTLTSKGVADADKATAYLAHHDVKSLFVTLRFIALSQEARRLDVPALDAALKESGMIRNALRTFTGICFFNREGIMVHRHSEYGQVDIVGKDYSFRRYFQQAMKGSAYISSAFRSDIGKQVAVVSVPIVGDDGQMVGVLSGGLNLEGIRSFLGAPLTHMGQIVGLVAIASPQESAFGLEELAVLAAIAEQAAEDVAREWQ